MGSRRSKRTAKKRRAIRTNKKKRAMENQRIEREKKLRSPLSRPLPPPEEWRADKTTYPVIWTELKDVLSKRVYLVPDPTYSRRSPRTGKIMGAFRICAGDHPNDTSKSLICYAIYGTLLAQSEEDAIKKVTTFLATGVKAPFRKRVDWMPGRKKVVVFVYFDSDLDLLETFSSVEHAKDFAEAQNLPELDRSLPNTGWFEDADRDVWYAGRDGCVSITKTVLDEEAPPTDDELREEDERLAKKVGRREAEESLK